ncbi:MAG: VOC family protein [Burkholderiaceae bacterium]|nr:VOC family protein [Burkholderiaceae bacterium]
MATSHDISAFGLFDQVRMGYVVIASRRLDNWRSLLEDGIGMHVVQSASGLTCRMDDHACRIAIKQLDGEDEDLLTLGLELTSTRALGEVLRRLQSQHIEVKELKGGETTEMGVDRAWRFTGPKGMQIELFVSPPVQAAHLQMKASGFVTGELGFGHMAIVTRRPQSMLQFWQSVFDMRLSDEVHERISGLPLEFSFLRFNKRHHSIAFGSTAGLKLNPFRTRIQHLEVQVASLEDLRQAYERCCELGFSITMEVGQHANDRAVSFYVKTPSGFDLECGWNPIAVDEATWTPKVWDRISSWGHRQDGVTLWDSVNRFGTALASLTKKEFSPL